MASSQTQAPEFGRVRTLLWPIHNFELKKFIPMFLMFFFVSFTYSILRIMKDSLIVNAPGSGAEAIPFLKLWCTTPAAILFMATYIKISTFVSREKLFYITLTPFLVFFILFPYALYPAIGYIHPTASADWLAGILPEGMRGLVAVYRNWTFSLFYVLAELWGSVVLSTLYWGFANEVTKVGEAKRFYGLLAIGANVALLFVSPATKIANSLGDWGDTLRFTLNLATVGCAAVAFFYWYINNKVMTDPRFRSTTPAKKKKKKVKMGFTDSLRELAGSKYLACLAIMVLAYGVSINLVEVTWKHNLKLLFKGDRQGFFAFQGQMMSATGIVTILFLWFGTGNVLRRFGWFTAAIFTPLVLLITAALFFANLTFQEVMTGIAATINATPLLIVAYMGGIQNVLSKGTKYSFFDPTKEMAYIPLDENTKRNGKAAIDGVGGRLGKSGGSLVNMVLIAMLGSVEAITPYIALVTLGIIALWIICVKALNTEFIALTRKQEEESASAKTCMEKTRTERRREERLCKEEVSSGAAAPAN